MKTLPPVAINLANQQSGLLTLTQLREANFQSREVHRRIDKGLWKHLTRTVIQLSPTPTTRKQIICAAGLTYPNFIVTGRSAMEYLGIQNKFPGPIDLVGSPSSVRLPPLTDWQVHRFNQPIPTHPHFNFLAHPTYAVLHAIGFATSTRQLVTLVSLATAASLVTLADLQTVGSQLPTTPVNTRIRRRLELLIPGANSLAEWDFAQECTRRGLPIPRRQSHRKDSAGRDIFLDAEFEINGKLLAVEIDGQQHFEASHRLSDQFRDNSLQIQDIKVLRVSTIQLRLDPDPFFAQLAEALQGLGWRMPGAKGDWKAAAPLG